MEEMQKLKAEKLKPFPKLELSPKQNDAGEDTSATIDDTLAERGNRYGSFADHAKLSQQLQKTLIMHTATRGQTLEPYMVEALTMICHKLARIANGDPHYDDSWRDIAGYAQLVVDILNGKNT
jgi:hypothetical protein